MDFCIRDRSCPISWAALVSTVLLLVVGGLSFGPCARADSDVFVQGKGVHRLLRYFVDSQHEYKRDSGDLDDLQIKLHDRVRALKESGGLPLANAMSRLGCFFLSLENAESAEQWCKQTVEIREKFLPVDHPDLAAAYHDLGCVQELLKRPDAGSYYEKAVSIMQSCDASEFQAYALQNYGELIYRVGSVADMKKAESILQESVKSRDQLSAENNEGLESVVDCLYLIADSLHERDKAEKLDKRLTSLRKNKPQLPGQHSGSGHSGSGSSGAGGASSGTFHDVPNGNKAKTGGNSNR
jgi:tetratricopeptide (TPR) repeat protein